MTLTDKVAIGLGFALHLVIGFVPFAVSGLVAPLWGVVVLGAFWVAMLAVAVVLVRRRRAILVPLVPVASLVGWFAFVSFGEAVLSWTA